MANFSLKSGATGYIIRVQNSNGFYREDSVSSSPAELPSLMPYTEYTLSIMAVNSGGRSQPSLPVTAKTGMIYLLRDKQTLQGWFFYPEWVMLSPGSRVFISSLTLACRRHLICCIVFYDLSPVSAFAGESRFVLPGQAMGTPQGFFWLLVLTTQWHRLKMSFPSLASPPSPGEDIWSK